MIEQLSLFVRMMRLKVVVTLWTFMLLGLARHTAHLTSPRLGAALLALGAGYAAATTANDIADVAIDRVNRPGDAAGRSSPEPRRSRICGEPTPSRPGWRWQRRSRSARPGWRSSERRSS
jgi:4-hydroxybenzoate polyprenyltransferase